jgi:hypothetical protein
MEGKYIEVLSQKASAKLHYCLSETTPSQMTPAPGEQSPYDASGKSLASHSFGSSDDSTVA